MAGQRNLDRVPRAARFDFEASPRIEKISQCGSRGGQMRVYRNVIRTRRGIEIERD